jgi:hypothetical protein
MEPGSGRARWITRSAVCLPVAFGCDRHACKYFIAIVPTQSYFTVVVQLSSLSWQTHRTDATVEKCKPKRQRIATDGGFLGLERQKNGLEGACRWSVWQRIATVAAIVTLNISLAHSLCLKGIAGDVETVGQLFFLRKHGCGQMQGYNFSRSM